MRNKNWLEFRWLKFIVTCGFSFHVERNKDNVCGRILYQYFVNFVDVMWIWILDCLRYFDEVGMDVNAVWNISINIAFLLLTSNSYLGLWEYCLEGRGNSSTTATDWEIYITFVLDDVEEEHKILSLSISRFWWRFSKWLLWRRK